MFWVPRWYLRMAPFWKVSFPVVLPFDPGSLKEPEVFRSIAQALGCVGECLTLWGFERPPYIVYSALSKDGGEGAG